MKGLIFWFVVVVVVVVVVVCEFVGSSLKVAVRLYVCVGWGRVKVSLHVCAGGVRSIKLGVNLMSFRLIWFKVCLQALNILLIHLFVTALLVHSTGTCKLYLPDI